MNEIAVFEFQAHEVRTVTDEHGEPWFVAKDVCDVLGIGNPTEAVRGLDEDEKGLSITETPGGKQSLTTVSESGLYALIFKSRKQEAKAFRKWVTSEVLPAIRKTGGYIKAATEETPEEIMARALIVAKATIDRIKEKNQKLTAENETMKPKALFADAVSTSKSSILIGELAKILKQNGVDTGQNRLFAWMRENEYLICRKGSDYNMPTQRSMEMGLFTIKERAINSPDGSVRLTKTVLVTGKGQIYFVNLFLKKLERKEAA